MRSPFAAEAFAANAEWLQRFEREARAAAALNHPDILAVHDVGRHNGRPYIVMELVPGETLAELLRRGRVSVERGLEIGAEIADALAAAHASGIVHRDLKPSNVMVMPTGHVKVLDFGQRPRTRSVFSGVRAHRADALKRTGGAPSPAALLKFELDRLRHELQHVRSSSVAEGTVGPRRARKAARWFPGLPRPAIVPARRRYILPKK